MNRICDSEKCTGCGLCSNLCDCIRMCENDLGFLRPEIDQTLCSNCGRCSLYCPALRPYEGLNEAGVVWAAWHKDGKILLQSSSGGAFSAFAAAVIRKGGIVFGAAFDSELRLRHVGISNMDELGALRGSKYIQSNIGQSYRQAKIFLEEGRTVFFTGTPCQIAALYRFLPKRYDQLFTADLICHGVPSPGHFSRYLSWLSKKQGEKIKAFHMRDKTFGWGYVVSQIVFSNGGKKILSGISNAYMYAFLNNLTIQPVCNDCPYASTRRTGDVTIADFWKIGLGQPFHHKTSKGVSLLLINSAKGKELQNLSQVELEMEPRSLTEAMLGQSRLGPERLSAAMKQKQKIVFEQYLCENNYEILARNFFCDKGLKRILKAMIPRSVLRKYHFLKDKIIWKIYQASKSEK